MDFDKFVADKYNYLHFSKPVLKPLPTIFK